MTKKTIFSHSLFLLTPVDYRLRPLLGVFRAYPARSLRDWISFYSDPIYCFCLRPI